MARVLIVDDSVSVRSLLASRLRAQGHEVEEAPDAETAAERAMASPPEVVVTDLVMPGLSGVQLCRLLRSDPATAQVPIVLLTASGDKRSRFWARSAGASAYVGKRQIDELVQLLPQLLAGKGAPPALSMPRVFGRRPLHRISAILDLALFDSVLAGEARALASCGELAKLFEGLVTLLNEVLTYRWVALVPARATVPVFTHMTPDARTAIEEEIRRALGIAATREMSVLEDQRACGGEGPPPHIATIRFAGEALGQLALGGTGRGLSAEDRHLFELVASELGGPVQMTLLHEDARRLASTDTLTGLLNRRAFLDALHRERARSDRHVYPMSFLLLDVDHFKRINDTHGHAAGDTVLRAIARVLEGVARRSDFVARWGGEEFVVALPQTTEAGARIAAERVRRAVVATPLEVGAAQPVRVTVSVGVASSESPWSPEPLIAAADSAMYVAKSRGRNRVEAAPCCDNPASPGPAPASGSIPPPVSASMRDAQVPRAPRSG